VRPESFEPGLFPDFQLFSSGWPRPARAVRGVVSRVDNSTENVGGGVKNSLGNPYLVFTGDH
jgi:hypothetical protein